MNVTVFDASGRPVRALQRNALCGQTGSFRWDGLDDKFAKLPLGPYVIFTEIFNLEGNTYEKINGTNKSYKFADCMHK